MTPSDRVIVPNGVMARQVGDQTVILDLGSGIYFGLDGPGTRIWTLLESGLTLAEACVAMADSYDAPLEVIEADLFDLVRNLAARNLVRIA